MSNIFFKQVGTNIQTILMNQGKTQQHLADQLGVSKQVMNKIVTGAKAINVEEIRKIADILNVSVESLLNVEEDLEEVHKFSFMGNVNNEQTKEKIEFLKIVIDEILMLEEYEND